MAYIYLIECSQTNKKYIGKTLTTIEQRWKEHIRDCGRKRCEKRPLYDAMQKYGIDCFSIKEIEHCTDSDASEREIYWIQYYDTYKNGYNATTGGDGKPYVDREKVIEEYCTTKKIVQVAQKLGLCRDTVRNILLSNNIDILSSGDISKTEKSIPVNVLSKDTGKIIHSFCSHQEASQWLILNNYSHSSVSSTSQKISEVCRNIRKSAYGFRFEYAHSNS